MRQTRGGRGTNTDAIDLMQLEETKSWMHHVVDLDGDGDPVTTRLERPIAPLSRSRRWSALGLRFGPDILAIPPTRRLTPRAHYQESPRASLTAHHCAAFVPEADAVEWGPYGFGPVRQPGAGISFRFYDVRPTQSMATIRLSAYVQPGATGILTLTGWYTSRRFHITGYADHTLDLFTTPPTAEIIVLGLEIGEGVTSVTFRELTYRTLMIATAVDIR